MTVERMAAVYEAYRLKRMAQVTGDTDTWVQVGHAVCLAYGFQPMRLV